MSENKYCLIGTLGLLEHEISLLQSIFRISSNRDRVRYKLILSNLAKAHIVIATIDNEAAMDEWQKIIENDHPPILVSVTPKELGKFPGHSFSRPFSPTKVLSILDQIADKYLSHLFDDPTFNGEDTATQRVFANANTSAQGKPRALVVDDSKTVQTQLNRELASSNIQADIAETGEQCLVMLEKNDYNIIFLDVVLPGIDGYQVCKNIRRMQDKKHIPVVMLTSKSSPFDKVRGSMAGCSSYLTKPVDYEKFHQVLNQYILQTNSK
jgi:twitching motility two-component system response regulator PilG